MQKYFPRLSGLEWLLILGMSLLYLLVTFYNLTSFPIFVDEAIYGRWSQIALHDAAWRFISLTDGKQPLFMWMTMPMFKLFIDPLTNFLDFLTRQITLLAHLFQILIPVPLVLFLIDFFNVFE